jgi:hypothetical protein
MPTRPASDYVSYIKAQVQTQTTAALPQARNILRYEGGIAQFNSITQLSDMRYVTTGRVAPARIAPRQIVMTRSNPKNLAQVGVLSGGGVLGGVVNRPAARSSGTTSLIVPQTNLIQNANASARGTTAFTGSSPAITK